PDAVPRFLDSHPAARAFVERLMQKPVPASYGQASYHAEHAFLFTAADGTSRFGRYRWMPEAGEAYLSPDDASKRSANFLREELESRLQKRPSRLPPFLATGSGWAIRRMTYRPMVCGSIIGRAGTAGGDWHLSDGRDRRAP